MPVLDGAEFVAPYSPLSPALHVAQRKQMLYVRRMVKLDGR